MEDGRVQVDDPLRLAGLAIVTDPGEQTVARVLVDPAFPGEDAIETANGFATPRIRPLHDQRQNGRFEMRGVLLLGRMGRELERRDAIELREKRALARA